MAAKNPFLQYALDVTTIDALQDHALAAASAGIDVLEIGTPAVSSMGLRTCLATLRGILPDIRIYADLKLMDFPNIELQYAFDHGANAASVMMGANNHVIEDALELSQQTGLDLFFSSMGYPIELLTARAETLISFGARAIVAHGSGRTREAAFGDMLQRLQLLLPISQSEIIAAGGITALNVLDLVSLKPKGIIVGRGISQASSVQEGVLSILSRLGR